MITCYAPTGSVLAVLNAHSRLHRPCRGMLRRPSRALGRSDRRVRDRDGRLGGGGIRRRRGRRRVVFELGLQADSGRGRAAYRAPVGAGIADPRGAVDSLVRAEIPVLVDVDVRTPVAVDGPECDRRRRVERLGPVPVARVPVRLRDGGRASLGRERVDDDRVHGRQRGWLAEIERLATVKDRLHCPRIAIGARRRRRRCGGLCKPSPRSGSCF